MTSSPRSWPDDVFQALRQLDVRQVAYVPDAGHARLIESCRADDNIKAVPLTTEEEGVALLAGAWLGGQRGVLLMQSSGIGNCINMLPLTRAREAADRCELPLMVHIGQGPPDIIEVLNYMKPNDILTHCFTYKPKS